MANRNVGVYSLTDSRDTNVDSMSGIEPLVSSADTTPNCSPNSKVRMLSRQPKESLRRRVEGSPTVKGTDRCSDHSILSHSGMLKSSSKSETVGTNYAHSSEKFDTNALFSPLADLSRVLPGEICIQGEGRTFENVGLRPKLNAGSEPASLQKEPDVGHLRVGFSETKHRENDITVQNILHRNRQHTAKSDSIINRELFTKKDHHSSTNSESRHITSFPNTKIISTNSNEAKCLSSSTPNSTTPNASSTHGIEHYTDSRGLRDSQNLKHSTQSMNDFVGSELTYSYSTSKMITKSTTGRGMTDPQSSANFQSKSAKSENGPTKFLSKSTTDQKDVSQDNLTSTASYTYNAMSDRMDIEKQSSDDDHIHSDDGTPPHFGLDGILSSRNDEASWSTNLGSVSMNPHEKKRVANFQPSHFPPEFAEIENLRQNLSNMISSPAGQESILKNESLSELLMNDNGSRPNRQSTESAKTDSLLGAQAFQDISPGPDSGLASSHKSVVSSVANTSMQSENRVLRESLERERCRRRHCEEQIARLQGRILESQQLLAVAQATEKKKDNMIAQLDKTMAKVSSSLKQREKEKVTMLEHLKSENDALQSENEKQKQIISEQNSQLKAARQQCEAAMSSEQACREQLKQYQEETTKRWEEAQQLTQLTSKQMESLGEDCLKAERQLKQVQDILAKEREEWRKKELELEHQATHAEIQCNKLRDEMERKLNDDKRIAEETRNELQDARKEAHQLREEKDRAVREKEKASLESSLLEAKWEAKLKSREAELTEQYETELKETREQLEQETNDTEEAIREAHKQQVNEMSSRHEDELRIQKGVHQREMSEREARWVETQRQYQTRLAECQQEILKLSTKLEKVQQQRFSLVGKLQHFLQSQCNEAVMMVSALDTNPVTPGNANTPVVRTSGQNTLQMKQDAHSESVRRHHEQAMQAVRRLHTPRDITETPPHEGALPFHPLDSTSTTLSPSALENEMAHDSAFASGNISGYNTSGYASIPTPSKVNVGSENRHHLQTPSYNHTGSKQRFKTPPTVIHNRPGQRNANVRFQSSRASNNLSFQERIGSGYSHEIEPVVNNTEESTQESQFSNVYQKGATSSLSLANEGLRHHGNALSSTTGRHLLNSGDATPSGLGQVESVRTSLGQFNLDASGSRQSQPYQRGLDQLNVGKTGIRQFQANQNGLGILNLDRTGVGLLEPDKSGFMELPAQEMSSYHMENGEEEHEDDFAGWMSQHEATLTSSPTKETPSPDVNMHTGPAMMLQIPTTQHMQYEHDMSHLSTGPLEMLESPMSSQEDWKEVALQKYISKLLEQSPSGGSHQPQSFPMALGQNKASARLLQAKVIHEKSIIKKETVAQDTTASSSTQKRTKIGTGAQGVGAKSILQKERLKQKPTVSQNVSSQGKGGGGVGRGRVVGQQAPAKSKLTSSSAKDKTQQTGTRKASRSSAWR